jgi:hypothetical protein
MHFCIVRVSEENVALEDQDPVDLWVKEDFRERKAQKETKELKDCW